MQSPASTATTPTWRHMQSGAAAPHLWQKVLSNLAVSEQAVSACSASHFFHDCSKEYMRIFWKKPILHLPHDASSLASLMEMSQRLAEQEGYVEGTTVMMKLSSGVHEVVGSCEVPRFGTCHKLLSVPFNNLFIVGQGMGETIVDGGFVAENYSSHSCGSPLPWATTPLPSSERSRTCSTTVSRGTKERQVARAAASKCRRRRTG